LGAAALLITVITALARMKKDLHVEKHWSQIHSLAFALLEHDQFDGDAVKRIVEKSRDG